MLITRENLRYLLERAYRCGYNHSGSNSFDPDNKCVRLASIEIGFTQERNKELEKECIDHLMIKAAS